MIYLIGVDHQFQHDGVDAPEFVSRRMEFERFLDVEISRLKPDLIAEEYSEEALRQMGDEFNSVIKPIAGKFGIEHRFCDPDRNQRSKLKIKNNSERENFWFSKIKDKINQDIIFICGNSHIDTFTLLLSEQRVRSKIIGGNAWSC